MAKVLVIDDDRVARAALGRRLDGMGHLVLFASDGDSGLAEARSERPDLVLLDLGLPTGDAFELIRQLTHLPGGAPLPVVVVSASDPDIYRDPALEAGAIEFFEKRKDLSELLGTVEALVGGSYDPGD
jgi:DNA-binding response OmpR family regulator